MTRASCILPTAGLHGQQSARLAALAALALALGGCGSKGAVSLSARVDEASIELVANPFGRELGGGFDLVLEVGEAAPRGTSVSLGAFSLQQESGTVYETLNLAASDAFPVEVAAGESRTVRMTLDGTQLVEEVLATTICASEVWITGVVTDTLSEGKPTPVSSVRFSASCP